MGISWMKNLVVYPHTKVKSGLATWDYTWRAQNQCENKYLSIVLKYQVVIKCCISFETNIITISYVIYMVNIATKLSSLLWQLLHLGLSIFCFFLRTFFSFQQFIFFPTYFSQYFAHKLVILLIINYFCWCISSFSAYMAAILE